MKPRHKSAIFITGIVALAITSINIETEITLDEESRATDMALSDALRHNLPIEELRQIITQNPDLLTVKLYFDGGNMPLEHAVRRLLYQECVALTSIHPEIYKAEFLLHLCKTLTLQARYTSDGPQHTYECLLVLYNTTPSDADLDTYQMHARAALTDYFTDYDINELLP